MNVTVTGPSAESFLTVYPDDVTRPLASNLNYVAGLTVPNLVIMRVPASGIIDFYNKFGAVHVLADVVGYYDGDKTTEAGRFVPMTPAREADTRVLKPVPGSRQAHRRAALARDQVPRVHRTPRVGDRHHGPQRHVTEPDTESFVTVFPADGPRPLASNLNFVAGKTVPNLVIVKISTGPPPRPISPNPGLGRSSSTSSARHTSSSTSSATSPTAPSTRSEATSSSAQDCRQRAPRPRSMNTVQPETREIRTVVFRAGWRSPTRRMLVSLLVVTLAAYGLGLIASPLASAVTTHIVVPATAGGPDNGGTAIVSTGIIVPDLQGIGITISASGTVSLCGDAATCDHGPDGGPGSTTPESFIPGNPPGCLAARVYPNMAWNCIGSSGVFEGFGGGELQLAVNDDFVSPGAGYDDNTGHFDVFVEQSRRAVTVATTLTGTDPGVDAIFLKCTSSLVTQAEIDARATTTGEVLVPVGGFSSTVLPMASGISVIDVWWGIAGVENVTCSVTLLMGWLPAGFSCTLAATPTTVTLYDRSKEIDHDAVIDVATACTKVATPVILEPNFTG